MTVDPGPMPSIFVTTATSLQNTPEHCNIQNERDKHKRAGPNDRARKISSIRKTTTDKTTTESTKGTIGLSAKASERTLLLLPLSSQERGPGGEVPFTSSDLKYPETLTSIRL